MKVKWFDQVLKKRVKNIWKTTISYVALIISYVTRSSLAESYAKGDSSSWWQSALVMVKSLMAPSGKNTYTKSQQGVYKTNTDRNKEPAAQEAKKCWLSVRIGVLEISKWRDLGWNKGKIIHTARTTVWTPWTGSRHKETMCNYSLVLSFIDSISWVAQPLGDTKDTGLSLVILPVGTTVCSLPAPGYQ